MNTRISSRISGVGDELIALADEWYSDSSTREALGGLVQSGLAAITDHYGLEDEESAVVEGLADVINKRLGYGDHA